MLISIHITYFKELHIHVLWPFFILFLFFLFSPFLLISKSSYVKNMSLSVLLVTAISPRLSFSLTVYVLPMKNFKCCV